MAKTKKTKTKKTKTAVVTGVTPAHTPVTATAAAATNTPGANGTLLSAAGTGTVLPATLRTIEEIRKVRFPAEILHGFQTIDDIVNGFKDNTKAENEAFKRGDIKTRSTRTAFKIKQAIWRGYDVYVAKMIFENHGDAVIPLELFTDEYSRFLKVADEYNQD